MWNRSQNTSRKTEIQNDPILRPEVYETNLEELVPYVHLKGHVWRQEGPYIVCDSCPVRHSFCIGIDKILTGIDRQGNPIIKKRKKV
jgi:hypothetical protein